MLDPVPWAIGEVGAEHSHEVARVLAYAATGGGDGVIAVGDAKVRALGTPGSSVRIAPGAIVALNRASAGASQSFVARVISDEVVPIAATGAGSGRTDLVALVVRDTSVAGNGSAPANPAKGPYLHVEVVPGVSQSVTRLQQVPGYEYVSGYALARVKLPASTGTVTGAMITDLRQLTQPKSQRVLVVGKPVASQGPTASWGTWPALTGQVLVPSWATHATVIASIESIKVNAGVSQGSMRAKLGTLVGAHRQYDFPSASGSIQSLQTVAADSVASMAGTVQTVSLETIAGAAGNLITLPASQQVFDIQFEQRVS